MKSDAKKANFVLQKINLLAKVREGYDLHEVHIVSITDGKYTNWDIQYERYERNDVMRCDLDF